MNISTSEFTNSLHDSISSEIHNCTGRNWNEDFITKSVLTRIITDFKNVYITDKTDQYSVAWDAFKQNGKPEKNYGDIAIIVRVSFDTNRHVEGVAFLEAKRIYDKSGEFDIIDYNQLGHYLNHTHAHRVLLYDNHIISEYQNNLASQLYCKKCYSGPIGSGYDATLPTQHALSLNVKTKELYKYSLPLSYILITRYLHGFELDFSTNSLGSAKGFIEKNGGAEYLFVVHVSKSKEVEPDPHTVEINNEHYARLIIEGNQQQEIGK